MSLVKPVVEAEGYVCWGIEFNTYGRRALLRVFIDHAKGISLDDCSAVSGQLSAILDVEHFIRQPYTLEVSSPGIERAFFEPEQYGDYVGSKIQVRCFSSINGRKNFVGFLAASDGEMIKVQIDDQCVDIPIADIRKAHLIVDSINQKSVSEIN